jgi:isopenicillin N synthase-like dioxygenase
VADIPTIDLTDSPDVVGGAIDTACRDVGFFTVMGHGVDPELIPRLRAASVEFFAQREADKAAIAMANGGAAWRGWFPLGGELTSGIPDGKEGLYFGEELRRDDPRVLAGVPLHGPNQFPRVPAALRELVLESMSELSRVGARILAAMAMGFGLDADWFSTNLTSDPTVLFRVFRYPPQSGLDSDAWGVREHTDYGLVTVLAHDGTPGLEVRTPHGWVDAPTDTAAFIINVGDMLEKLTGGRYRSTPHRVRNPSDHDRYSFPLFLDPSWDATVVSLPIDQERAGLPTDRWDGDNPLAWSGTYGEYLTSRVAKVFPDLFADVTVTPRPDPESPDLERPDPECPDPECPDP